MAIRLFQSRTGEGLVVKGRLRNLTVDELCWLLATDGAPRDEVEAELDRRHSRYTALCAMVCWAATILGVVAVKLCVPLFPEWAWIGYIGFALAVTMGHAKAWWGAR